jgi:cytochrome-b5 reductase
MQIAGGSGITPMLQVIEAILKNSDDKTQVGCKLPHYKPPNIYIIQFVFLYS